MASRSRGGEAGSFRLNSAGIKEMLMTEAGIRQYIAGLTSKVADDAREGFPDGFPVLDGIRYPKDRPQGNVTVANRSAEAYEGKHGVLSRAAGAAGFDPIKQYPER